MVVAPWTFSAMDLLLEDCEELTDAEVGILYRAAHLAYKWHLTQRRGTGEPFADHLHATEHILVTLGFKTYITIRIAAKLHDLIEDCDPEKRDMVRAIILKWFGQRVLDIVEALTKKEGVDYYQQLAEAVEAGLWEVAFIKAADRLHNLTTINGFNNYGREMKYYRETLGPLLNFFIYARLDIPLDHLRQYEDLVLSVINLTFEMESGSRKRESHRQRELDLALFPTL